MAHDPENTLILELKSGPVTVEAQHLVERTAARIEQNVGATEQAQHVLLARRGLQVEHDRFLVAVVVPEEQRAFQSGLVLEIWTDTARGGHAVERRRV